MRHNLYKSSRLIALFAYLTWLRLDLLSFCKQLALGVATVCLFSACASRPRESKTLPSAIRIGLFPNITHAPAILGFARGDFKKCFAESGIAVEPVLFSAGPTAIEALFANRVDIAYVGPGPAINGYVRSGGREVVLISGCAANGVAIVARPGSGIRNLSDLAGKKIAVPAIGNTQFLSATYFLDRLTTDPQLKRTTRTIPVDSSDAVLLLKKGQIDAAWLPELWAALLEVQDGMLLVGEERELWPEKSFPSAVVVARRDFAVSHPDLLQRFYDTHVALCSELRSNGKQLAGVLADELYDLTHKQVAVNVVNRALERIEFTPDINRGQIELIYKMAEASGFLRRAQRVKLRSLFYEPAKDVVQTQLGDFDSKSESSVISSTQHAGDAR